MDVFSICNFVYFQDEFNKAVIGSVVLTDYNNRTYVISDISWNESPNSTFDRDGNKISYVEYYNSVSKHINKQWTFILTRVFIAQSIRPCGRQGKQTVGLETECGLFKCWKCNWYVLCPVCPNCNKKSHLDWTNIHLNAITVFKFMAVTLKQKCDKNKNSFVLESFLEELIKRGWFVLPWL